jgi:NodT family efflux transporter outer membrane factor (OMF) lipoprotein
MSELAHRWSRESGRLALGSAVLIAVGLSCGCTSWPQYVHNGFKVGPNYCRPPAPVAPQWIDANDVRVKSASDDLSKWWTVFNDPVLNSLICFAYQQNLSLRVAGFRVLEARAQLLIDTGNLFPQTQTMNGDYTRNALSRETANPLATGAKRWFQQWDYGFNLRWEIDFWGRFRRAIESDQATLDASADNYNDVLVTLLGDLATNYVQYRTFEERIRVAKTNVALQQKTLQIVEGQLKAGIVGELDVDQARSTLEQTQAEIPELEISLRQSANQICILLGTPPEDLGRRLGSGKIPTAPVDVVVGIPADLLRRRPDVRRAERQAAAQSAEIGIAEAEFYPHISINGTIDYAAERFNNLFQAKAFSGTFGPTFTWNILNYGRTLNGVRLQDARFRELVATYQNTVLSADQDVENGIVTFLRAQERTKFQAASADDAEKAVNIALAQYTQGVIDLTRVTLLQQNLVQLQDVLAQAQGEIATGLIQVYRALGGGWPFRGCPPDLVTSAPAEPKATEKSRVKSPEKPPDSMPMPKTLEPMPKTQESHGY